ncbi:hypothetical protein FRB90_010865, partial [Tulasnella sp. 427]
MSTRPRRAAATKATAANTAIATGKDDTAASAPAPKNSKKRTASAANGSGVDDAADGDGDDGADDDGEESQPKKKKAKTAKGKAAAKAKPAASRKGRGKKSAPTVDNSDDDANDKDQKMDGADNDDGAGTQNGAQGSSANAAPAPPPKSPTPPPPKMVKVVQRGAAPVDAFSGFTQTHEVLTNNGEVYDAMLHQTDVGKNANKFYVIQLLHPIGNTAQCTLFTRWGRTGENGQTQKKGPFALGSAIGEFEKQFKSKTAANWANRKTMVRKNGKYFWIERDFETDENQKEDDEPADDASDGKGKGKEVTREKTPESTAPEEVQNLIKLIFNVALMDAVLKELNYDANK